VLRGILPHARRVIEVIEAAYCSAESGEAQELRSSFEPATG
jgi:hypothetical protein